MYVHHNWYALCTCSFVPRLSSYFSGYAKKGFFTYVAAEKAGGQPGNEATLYGHPVYRVYIQIFAQLQFREMPSKMLRLKLL